MLSECIQKELPQELITLFKELFNPQNQGWDPIQQKWVPYKEYEVKTPLIAYGFPCTSFSIQQKQYITNNGMTMEEANEILNNGMNNALNEAKIAFDALQQEGEFDSLKQPVQLLLMYITYTIGTITNWPHLQKRCLTGNLYYVLKGSIPYEKDTDCNHKQRQRNERLSNYLMGLDI